MKYSRMLTGLPVWAVLMAALHLSPSEARSQAAPPAQGTDQAEVDIHACKAQLNRIFEALQHYQVKHQQLPNWFFDLHPDFVDDRKIFLCPVVRRGGDLLSWRAQLRTEMFWDPILPTSYAYEFCVKELQLAPGVQPTCREYKKRQMALVGDQVPVLRCFAHDQVLNVSIGGRFYSSGRYWENEFDHIVRHEQLEPQNVFRDLLTVFLAKPRSYPSRDTTASARLLDLTKSYNLGLNETVRFGSAGEEDFAHLPRGIVKLNRVPVAFDIRGRVQLGGKRMRIPFPPRVDGIKVNQQCRHARFLCGTVYGAAVGTEIGRFNVHYADGQFKHIPITYGKDVQDWLFDPQKPQSTSAPVAWDGASPARQAQGKFIRLHHLQWENPLPDAQIATLDFVSALTDAAPFLIAITLE